MGNLENFHKTDMVPMANRLKSNYSTNKWQCFVCHLNLFPFIQIRPFVSGIVSERHAFFSVRGDPIAYRLGKPLRMYKTLAILTMMKRIPNSYYNHGLDISKVVTFTREMQFKKFI